MSAVGRSMERAAPDARRFYDTLWAGTAFVPPQRFNTWPLLSALARLTDERLEVGPGVHPRLPVAGTWFVDTSPPAVNRLAMRGAHAVRSDAGTLPFPDQRFDLVCAFDVIEHVDDDRRVFGELARVARDHAWVVLSVPLHPARWTVFDDFVGHLRRYDPDDLLATLERRHLVVERSAGFGMAPRSRWLLAFATWGLTHRPQQAMRLYDRVFRPLGLRLQRKLAWTPGLDAGRADDVVLVCRRRGRVADRPAVAAPKRPSEHAASFLSLSG